MIPSDTPRHMPNCGVVAVATLAGISYADAHQLFRVTFNMPPRWRGRTQATQRRRIFKILGLPDDRIYGRMTFRRWVAEVFDPAINYEVTITGHVVAIKDGMMFDQTYSHGISPHRSPYSRKYVRSWICVTS